MVVVYKVDRLTRSLTDFAKLVDLFDRHGVSFVSITQSFNTTTSMGRLTLNVLLSFAQFEREVIGERVRDKIAASKRKGLWMGGPVPLGYANVDKKLVIVESEAETVRTIFRKYLELGSIQALATDLHKQGLRTKERSWSNERTVGGVRFGTGPLAYLLKNRVYIGEVSHQKQIFQGDHAPILDRELFDAVQIKLQDGTVERRLKLKASPAILTGKMFDDHGNRMTPSHTVKKGVRYRYYISSAALQKRGAVGSVSRVPAAEIEELVVHALQSHCSQPENGTDVSKARILERLEKVVITAQMVHVHVGVAQDSSGTETEYPPTILPLPWIPPKRPFYKGAIQSPSTESSIRNAGARDVLMIAIAKARAWVEELVADRTTIVAIAKREGKGERYIRLLLPLAFAGPTIVEALVLDGPPPGITVTRLAQLLPNSWAAQTEVFR